jgi:hypothetical protein
LFSHRSDPQRTPRVRFGPSLAAALLNGLFEHPATRVELCSVDENLVGEGIRRPA